MTPPFVCHYVHTPLVMCYCDMYGFEHFDRFLNWSEMCFCVNVRVWYLGVFVEESML